MTQGHLALEYIRSKNETDSPIGLLKFLLKGEIYKTRSQEFSKRQSIESHSYISIEKPEKQLQAYTKQGSKTGVSKVHKEIYIKKNVSPLLAFQQLSIFCNYFIILYKIQHHKGQATK